MNWTRLLQSTFKLLLGLLLFLYLSRTYSKIFSLLAVVSFFFLFRTLARAISKTLKIDFKCECGKVCGYIKLIKEDSLPLDCYCHDCQNFATWLSQKSKNSKLFLDECGGSHLLQICKTDFHITEDSKKFISLTKKEENGNFYRYYSNCCNTPIYQCLKPLGLATVFVDTLDKSKIVHLDKAVQVQTEGAIKQPENITDVFLPDMLEKIARFQWYSKHNPFEFSPVSEFWGEKK
eukprot:gene99-4348_t